MQILQDTSSDSNGGTAQTHSYSHTVTAGYQGTILIATAAMDMTSGGRQNSLTAKYNSVSMTPLYRIGDGDATAAMFYLVNPATGSNTLLFELPGGNNAYFAVCACAFFYVNITDPFVGSATTANGTSTAPSVSVPAIPGGLVIDGMGFQDTGDETPTAGQTLIDIADATVVNAIQKANGESGNITMSWTLPTSRKWYTGGICLRAISGDSGAIISPTAIF